MKSSNTKFMIVKSKVVDDIKAYGFSEKRIKHWLDQGLDINWQDKIGDTLLLATIDLGKYPIAKFLIDEGANVNLPNNKGNVPIMYVNPRYLNTGQMIDYLLKNNADPCKKNKRDLWLKCSSNIESLKLLSPKLKEALSECWKDASQDCPLPR